MTVDDGGFSADHRSNDDPTTPLEDDGAPHEVCLDVFGLKAKPPKPALSNPVVVQDTVKSVPRDWLSVWEDCVAEMQMALVLLASLPAASLEAVKKVIVSVGSVSQFGAEIVQRVARARARADHEEDERIAASENASDHSEGHEHTSSPEEFLKSIESFQAMVQARGGTMKAELTDEGQVIFCIVPEGTENEVLQTARLSLVREALQTSSQSSDSALESLRLPVRIVNALKSSGINSVDQLRSLSIDELRSIPGIGDKSVIALRSLLERPSDTNRSSR